MKIFQAETKLFKGLKVRVYLTYFRDNMQVELVTVKQEEKDKGSGK